MFKAIKLDSSKDSNINLMLKGQGVYLFDSIAPCTFSLLNHYGDGYDIHFHIDKVEVVRTSTGKSFVDPDNKYGITNKSGAYYWFSLDSQNQTFSAGIGEARIENRIYTYTFKFEPEEEHMRIINKKFLETICKIVPSNTKPLKLLRDPITQIVPLKILNSNDLTMDLVEFKKLMKAEWDNYLKSQVVEPKSSSIRSLFCCM